MITGSPSLRVQPSPKNVHEFFPQLKFDFSTPQQWIYI